MTLVNNVDESVFLMVELFPKFSKRMYKEMNNMGVNSGRDYYQGKGCFLRDFIQGEFSYIEKNPRGTC